MILGAALAAVLGLALTSVLSAMIERSGPIRLRHWVEGAGGRLLALWEAPGRFEAFRFLLSVIAKVAPAVLAILLLLLPEGLVGGHGRWLALGLVTLLVLLLELINRRLVGRDPETVLRHLTRFYLLALLLLTPLVAIAAPLMPRLDEERSEEEDDDEVTDEEISAFIDVGTREGILDPHEGELVRSVVDFGYTLVRSVMTPRIDVVCAPVESTLDELADVFVESTHSRIPLYQRSIDQIVGVLHLRDLLRGLRSAEPPTAQELAKPVWLVPETKSLDEVLAELQERRQQMAVVIDEYGGTAGLVTIEDLLEEIVGEIVDLDEELPPQIQRLPDGSWRFDGRMRVEELERLFGLSLDDEPYETVGGMVFTGLGYVPEPGDSVESHGLRFTVETLEDRRIQTVRIERLVPADASQGGDHDG
ncbi:MAG: HlyC/CorC family transporter [Acidobacteria bacterium]|nr:HlyC/CorC family transporter [Acidobacteriota bacterium]